MPPTLLLQSKSVRHGADLLSHAILYWIEFRIFCFALSHIRIINKDKKKILQDAASITKEYRQSPRNEINFIRESILLLSEKLIL